jgi:uncharacterized integral membrane protein
MNIRAYISLLLLLLVVVFIVQNANVVDIQFLSWKISTSLMIFSVLATSFIIGWITAGHFHNRHDLTSKKSLE